MHTHGFVKYEWQNNILRIDTFGPFNLKGINEAFDNLKQTVKTHTPPKWYRVDILDEETLGGLDVMEVIALSYKWSIDNHCQFIAIVCANSIQLGLFEMFIKKNSLPIHAFDTLDDAFFSVNNILSCDASALNVSNLCVDNNKY